MDIYNFLCSSDIADHCRNIGHTFSPLDMAVLVAMSDKTIKEKHEAWREIIADYPDMPIHDTLNFDARESLYEYLRELIAYEEKRIETFYAQDDCTVYRFRVLWQAEWSDKHSGVYTTYDKAWASIWEYWGKEDQITCFEIEKVRLNDSGITQARTNSDGELLSLYHFGFSENMERNLDNLEMIFIHLPVPFENGDLVDYDGKPSVLTYLPHWYTEKPGITYEERLSGKWGDGSDMHANVHYIGDDGTLDYAHVPFHRLKYWHSEFEGQNRFLKHLSYFIKQKYGYDDIYELEALVSAFCKYKAESDSKMYGAIIEYAEDRIRNARQS